MSEYVILTDSSCDLTAQMADELGLLVLPLSVNINGREYLNYLDEREIASGDFYGMLREGHMGKTAAANPEQFIAFMEPVLKEGKDLLYLAFSSGLSGTYHAGTLAAAELEERYPGRRVCCVDTLCASMGQGLLVYHAAMRRKEGKTLEEVRDYVLKTRLQLCHWFTVDDLNHLKRGGRLSSGAAMIGTLLNIKPVLHVDDEGHLINMEKVRGRRAAIQRLADHLRDTAFDPADQTIFISHGDCLADAEHLAALLKEQFGIRNVHINAIGPVIGAHSGPGTLALFFLGSRR